jgi:hypothetical protein
MKTPAKEFGIWNVLTMLRPQMIKEYHNTRVQHTCHGYTEDQMVRGSNNQPQNSYTASDQEKLRRECGVALTVDNRSKENILSFQPIGDRICTLRTETK